MNSFAPQPMSRPVHLAPEDMAESIAPGLRTGDLEGTTFTTDTDDGSRIRHDFRDGWVTWRYLGLRVGSETRGINPYEAFRIDEGLYFVQFQRDDRPIEAASLVLDVVNGRTVAAVSTMGALDREGRSVLRRVLISELEDHEVRGEPIRTGSDRTGTAARWRGRPDVVIEQDFVAGHRVLWRWLGGRFDGACHEYEVDTWVIRPDIHLVAARDASEPVAWLTVVDHRDPRDLRCAGVLFGLGEAGTAVVHKTFSMKGASRHPAT